MRSDQFIRKIRIYALISFFLPLIIINLCLFIFKFLGDFHTYPTFNWDEKKIEQPYKEYIAIYNNFESWTLTNCPKYKYSTYDYTIDNQIIKSTEENSALIEGLRESNKVKSIVREQGNIKNDRCVKNFKFAYLLLNNFSVLEKFMLIAKEKNISGFGKVKNPYLYGEVSISRTARYFPATLIFKPFIILGAIFLLLYWINNLKLFKELESRNILVISSRKFFYFGVFSCVFLILHALFLGLDFDSELFRKIRKLIIILFILFEILAQIFLTKILFQLKENLKNYINPLFLKIKIVFVSMILVITFIVFGLLIWGDLDGTHKHVIEWNYFSSLLLYYLLSRLLWRKAQKNQKS